MAKSPKPKFDEWYPDLYIEETNELIAAQQQGDTPVVVNQQCKNCVFFKRASATTGVCRFFPPFAVQDSKMFEGRKEQKDTDWCGQFAYPPEPEEEETE